MGPLAVATWAPGAAAMSFGRSTWRSPPAYVASVRVAVTVSWIPVCWRAEVNGAVKVVGRPGPPGPGSPLLKACSPPAEVNAKPAGGQLTSVAVDEHGCGNPDGGPCPANS